MERILGEPPQPPPERRQSCSWCHVSNVVRWGRKNYCGSCGHRADLPRSACDCQSCEDLRLAAGAVQVSMQPPAPMPVAADELLEEMCQQRDRVESAALFALQGLLAGPRGHGSPAQVAGKAVAMALALIEALDRQDKDDEYGGDSEGESA